MAQAEGSLNLLGPGSPTLQNPRAAILFTAGISQAGQRPAYPPQVTSEKALKETRFRYLSPPWSPRSAETLPAPAASGQLSSEASLLPLQAAPSLFSGLELLTVICFTSSSASSCEESPAVRESGESAAPACSLRWRPYSLPSAPPTRKASGRGVSSPSSRRQLHKSVVLTGDNFAPAPGTRGNTGRCFWLLQLRRGVLEHPGGRGSHAAQRPRSQTPSFFHTNSRAAGPELTLIGRLPLSVLGVCLIQVGEAGPQLQDAV